ncbi:MAG: efflux transporter outer membrane subunit [Balneolaceae bacterium]
MKKQSVIKLASVPIILFTLQSCFTAKNYVRPEVVDEAYFRTDQLPQDSLAMAEISWQELFEDEILRGYVEEGLENNLDIRIALEQINAAEAYYRQGRASYYPDLNTGVQASRQQLSENSQTGSGDLTQYELTGTLSWEADIWGRIRSDARAYEASYLQTAAAHKAVKTELIANIASVYFQLLSLDEQRRITGESVSNRKRSLETTRSLKEAGYVTEAGVMQTEAQIYTAQALLIEIRTNIKLLENTMSILLGKAPGEIERGRLDQQEITQETEVGYPVQLLRNRPDVIAAEYNLINAFELVNVARSDFYPSLNISVTGGFQSMELDNLLSANSIFSAVIGSLTQPVFNRRRIRTRYEVSLSQQEQAYLDFRQAILNAGREVSDALYSLEAAEERIEVESLEYEAYEAATDYSEELLNNGLVNYLEVLTARENALNSQLSLINARYDRLNSIVELYRALGGGWQ